MGEETLKAYGKRNKGKIDRERGQDMRNENFATSEKLSMENKSSILYIYLL